MKKEMGLALRDKLSSVSSSGSTEKTIKILVRRADIVILLMLFVCNEIGRS
jgi:hypothetical protein